jgi:hypothetical protein
VGNPFFAGNSMEALTRPLPQAVLTRTSWILLQDFGPDLKTFWSLFVEDAHRVERKPSEQRRGMSGANDSRSKG